MTKVFKLLVVVATMTFVPVARVSASKGCIYYKGGVQMTAPNKTRTTFTDGLNECKNGTWVVIKAAKTAKSLRCQDGMVLAYCKISWSDGSSSPIPWGVGPRRGGVVDAIIYYDLQWNPTCILLYADGSIMTSYDLGKC